MDTLDRKRSRPRRELQTAYSAWLKTSDIYPSPKRSEVELDACYGAPARFKWAEYIAARKRMVLAYAEPTLGT